MVKKRVIIKKFRSFMYSVIKYINEDNNENRGRPDKFKPWYYIKYILRVLFYGDTWDSLECA